MPLHRDAILRTLGPLTTSLRTKLAMLRGVAALGFVPFLPPAIQALPIVTFHAPADAAYEFKRFYDAAKRHGFILYPGKLTQIETFGVGCIGAIGKVSKHRKISWQITNSTPQWPP